MMGDARPLQHREAYWGNVEYVRATTGLALKRIFMRAGSKSSLEFHVLKHELYWIVDGQLELAIRDGNKRGEDTSVILLPGDCYEIPPGTMHQRKAITDVVILEACSFDSEADTHIVLDGRN